MEENKYANFGEFCDAQALNLGEAFRNNIDKEIKIHYVKPMICTCSQRDLPHFMHDNHLPIQEIQSNSPNQTELHTMQGPYTGPEWNFYNKKQNLEFPELELTAKTPGFKEWTLHPTIYPVTIKIYKYDCALVDFKNNLKNIFEERGYDFERDEIINTILLNEKAFHIYLDESSNHLSILAFPTHIKNEQELFGLIMHQCTHSAVKIFNQMRMSIEPGYDEPFAYFIGYLVKIVSAILLKE